MAGMRDEDFSRLPITANRLEVIGCILIYATPDGFVGFFRNRQSGLLRILLALSALNPHHHLPKRGEWVLELLGIVLGTPVDQNGVVALLRQPAESLVQRYQKEVAGAALNWYGAERNYGSGLACHAPNAVRQFDCYVRRMMEVHAIAPEAVDLLFDKAAVLMQEEWDRLQASREWRIIQRDIRQQQILPYLGYIAGGDGVNT